MRETVLNDPLSGAEIREIVLQKVEDALKRDCTLVDDLTYPGFTLKFEATIAYQRATTAGTLVWHQSTTGKKPEGETDENLIEAAYQTDSPNRAREDHDLPMPVMVQTPSGPKRQKVKIDRETAKAQKRLDSGD